MSESYDWSRFTLRIFINKEISKLYDAWTIPSQISTWFLEKADYVKPDGSNRNPGENVEAGDSYSWKWYNWDVTEKGIVLAANGKDEFSFTFGAAGHVTVSFAESENGTEVKLVQSDIPVDEEGRLSYNRGCTQGWTFWLTNLKAWLEYGILLNAKGFSTEETKYLVNS